MGLGAVYTNILNGRSTGLYMGIYINSHDEFSLVKKYKATTTVIVDWLAYILAERHVH